MQTFGKPQKTIVFTIEDGQVTVETTGFTGTACEAASKEFTDALGGGTVSNKRKPEFFKTAEHAQSQRAGA